MELLEQYYRDNREALIKKIKNRAITPENAEDIIQEAFLRAWKYWPSFDPNIGHIEPWFGIILNNSLKDYMKSVRLLGMAYELDEDKLEPHEVNWDELTKDRDIDALLSTKNGLRREVLTLALKYNYTTKEIGQLINANKRTISQYIWEFKQELKT